MSFRSQGSFGPTVIVSRLPDRSGNFVCDGTADDVEINAAIAHADSLENRGSILIKKGDYNIDANIVIDDRKTIRGEGVDVTTITRSGNGIIITIQSGVGWTEGVVLSDMTLNGGGFTGTILSVSSSRRIKLDNLRITNSAEIGLRIEPGSWGIECNRIYASANNIGVSLEANHGIIDNSILRANVQTNIQIISTGRSNIVSNSIIEGATGGNAYNMEIIGGAAEGYAGHIIHACSFENAPAGGGNIRISTQTATEIRSVKIIDNWFSEDNICISVAEATDTMIFNNYFGGTGTAISIAASALETWVFFNDFNTVTYVVDNGVDTITPEIWEQAPNFNANLRDHPAQQMLDGVDTYIRNQVQLPFDFQQLLTAQIVVVQTAGANPNVVWTCDTDFGKICAGEDYFQHSDSIGSTTTALAQHDFVCLDISAAFTGVAAGDLVGISFMRDGDNGADTVSGPVYYMGVRIRYV